LSLLVLTELIGRSIVLAESLLQGPDQELAVAQS
jgi:hypothetical protein